jgi:hypothetical protein
VIAGACGSSSNPTTPTPPAGTVTTVTAASRSSSTIQLAAVARLSDGSERDVSTLATWQSSNAVLASVSPTGLVTMFGTGEVDIRATYQSVSGSLHLLVANASVAQLTISSAPSGPAASFQLTATARFADGSTQDVTRSATWASSNTGVATVSSGLVSVVADGEVDIRATFQGTTAVTHIAVARPKGYTLTGFVTDAATTSPLAGVRVQLVGGTSTQTDERGAFGLAVTQGRVLVEFSKTGYRTLEKDLTVNGDSQMIVSLTPLATTAQHD